MYSVNNLPPPHPAQGSWAPLNSFQFSTNKQLNLAGKSWLTRPFFILFSKPFKWLQPLWLLCNAQLQNVAAFLNHCQRLMTFWKETQTPGPAGSALPLSQSPQVSGSALSLGYLFNSCRDNGEGTWPRHLWLILNFLQSANKYWWSLLRASGEQNPSRCSQDFHSPAPFVC